MEELILYLEETIKNIDSIMIEIAVLQKGLNKYYGKSC